MQSSNGPKPFVFPKSTRFVLPLLLGGLLIVPGYLLTLIGYGASPDATTVGYQPAQPLGFSHDLHAGQLGMDCRYCHTTVDRAAMAAVPPTQTCWNCHSSATGLRKDSPQLAPVMSSQATGMPIEWIKVHDLADYVYFNHSRHVNSGVSCVECHGRIDRMAVEPGSTRGVYQAKPLSMAWCIECHRNPDAKIRPADQVYNLAWGQKLTEPEKAQLVALLGNAGRGLEVGHPLSEDQKAEIGRKIRLDKKINPSTDCTTCHR